MKVSILVEVQLLEVSGGMGNVAGVAVTVALVFGWHFSGSVIGCGVNV